MLFSVNPLCRFGTSMISILFALPFDIACQARS
jgi:hypothetical protein